MRARFALRALALAGFGIVGCQAIAGIEDRTYQASVADAGSGASALCKKYCKEVTEACTDEKQQYVGTDNCLGVCSTWKEGEIHEPRNNTVACREAQARNALMAEPATFCKSAGPSGDSACATGCESYCALFTAICSNDETPLPDCVPLCKALLPDVDVNPAAAATGDSLECRLYHVSAAAAAEAGSPERKTHCGHARLANPTDNCIEMDTMPNCDRYCKVVQTACDGGDGDAGSTAIYDDPQQCRDACNQFAKLGTNTDEEGDTLGCRTYHAFNAILFQMPELHCPHAGPGGDGACGDNCDSYCELVAKVCGMDAKDHFAMTDCKTECGKLEGAKGGSGYNVGAAGNTVQCRLLHTVRAIQDKTECAAALGGGACK